MTAPEESHDAPSGPSPRTSVRATPLRLRRLGIALSGLVVALGVWSGLAEPWYVADLRNAVFDAYQRSQPRPWQPTPVRIVDIDEESLARLGQWPWPRSRLADMVARLRAAGAEVITFDFMFAEPDRTSPAWLATEWADQPEVADVLRRLPDHDATFAAEIGRGNVVAAFALTTVVEGEAPVAKARFVRMGAEGPVAADLYSGTVASLRPIQEAAAGNGAVNFSPDRDGVVRRVPLVLDRDGELYPSLAAEALRVATGARNHTLLTAPRPRGDGAVITAVRIGPLTLPTDSFGRVRIYLSPPNPDRYIPAWKVFEEDAAALVPPGAILFLGSSATGLKDLRFGTLGEILPGVEIHAQLAEQALLGVFATRPLWVQGLEILVIVLCWLLMLAFGWSHRALPAALAALGGIATIGIAALALWYTEAVLADPLFPGLVLAATFVAYTVPRQLAAESESRWIRTAFSNYLSPNLVAHLIRHPDELRLGGERRECSFVLTDVVGFTSLVEASDPHELTEVINGYLDGMVRIAFAYDGTLDRIVGDAVAVLFSAPVTQPDHAERAVRCALEMDAFAADYSRRCRERGVPFGSTRIGVNTGEVVVGNFGGGSHFDYRPLGDPINTAARLETANRHLGTRVCVSGTTVERCPGFVGRPAGTVVLKGKSQGVEVFEPLTEEEAARPAVAAYIAAFEKMRHGQDEAAIEAMRAVCAANPDDGLAAFHLARLERGERGPRVVFAEK